MKKKVEPCMTPQTVYGDMNTPRTDVLSGL